MNTELTISVRRCSACTGAHTRVAIEPLDEPIVFEEQTWTHTGLCPATGERLFVRDLGAGAYAGPSPAMSVTQAARLFLGNRLNLALYQDAVRAAARDAYLAFEYRIQQELARRRRERGGR